MKIPLILFLLTGLLFAAPQQLVLLGEPRELLDLLQAELSEEADFSLLARAEIDLILREQQLSAHDPTQLLQLFPHADLLAILTATAGRPEHLLLFNARNGFRLAEESIASKDLSAAAGELANVIRGGARKTQAPKPHYLAINLLRYVSIDLQQANNLQKWLRLFSSELLRHHDIQLLERENLGRVLTERELAAQRFALTPSTRLLTFEFETGDSVEIIKLRVYCHDLSGRELLRLTQQNILADRQAAIAQLIAELHGALSEMPIAAAVADAANQEAENFYESSLKTWNPEEALAKIEAAVALAPDNETFRYAEILAHAKICSFFGKNAHLEHAKRTLKVIERFQKDFPQSTQLYFPECVLTRWWSLASHLEHQINEATVRQRDDELQELQKNQKELAEFYALVRPAILQDRRRQPQYAFDLSDGLNNADEGQRFEKCFNLVFNKLPLYVQRKEWLNDCFAAHLEYLRVLEREYQRNPALAKATQLMSINWVLLLREAKDRQAFSEFFQENTSFLTFLDSSMLPDSKMQAGELRLILSLLQNLPHREKVKQIYRAYFAALVAEDPACFNDLKFWRRRLNVVPYSLLNNMCYKLPDNYAWTCLEEFLGLQRADTALDRLEKVLHGKGEDEEILSLLEVADELSSFGGACLRQYRFANAFRDLSFLIWEREQPDLPKPLRFLKLSDFQAQLFAALNHNFELQYGRFDEALTYDKPLLCLATCPDGDGLLLLLGAFGRQSKVLLARVNADGCMTMLPIILHSNQAFWFGHPDGVEKSVFLCDEEHILIIVQGRGFLVKRQEGAEVTSFSDLQDRGESRVLLNKRVYILSDKSLHSMNLMGQERRLHFSQSRLNSEHELEKGGKTHNLVAAKNGDLFFLVTFPVSGKTRVCEELWRFDPRQEFFERVLELPPGKYHALQEGETLPLLLRMDRQNSTIFQLESTGGALRELVRLPDKDKFRLARFHSSNFGDHGGPRPFPFFLQDGILWTGGLHPACIKLTNPEQSPLLWLPRTHTIFALEKEILFLRSDYWFKLKLP